MITQYPAPNAAPGSQTYPRFLAWYRWNRSEQRAGFNLADKGRAFVDEGFAGTFRSPKPVRTALAAHVPEPVAAGQEDFEERYTEAASFPLVLRVAPLDGSCRSLMAIHETLVSQSSLAK